MELEDHGENLNLIKLQLAFQNRLHLYLNEIKIIATELRKLLQYGLWYLNQTGTTFRALPLLFVRCYWIYFHWCPSTNNITNIQHRFAVVNRYYCDGSWF